MPRPCSEASDGILAALKSFEGDAAARGLLSQNLKRLWKVLARATDGLPSTLQRAWPLPDGGPECIAAAVLGRIRRQFPFGRRVDGVDLGNKALRGLMNLLELGTDPQAQQMILTIFNRGFISRGEDLVHLLHLIDDAAENLAHVPEGLKSLLISMRGRNSLSGVWYQLEWMKRKGFARMFKIEGGEDVVGRALDAELISNLSPRFYELKNANYRVDLDKVGQIVDQLADPSIGPGRIQEYRVAYNGAGVTDAAFHNKINGGRMLKHLSANQMKRGGILGPWPDNIRNELLRRLKAHLDAAFPERAPINVEDLLASHRTYLANSNIDRIDPADQPLIESARSFIGELLFQQERIDEVRVAAVGAGGLQNYQWQVT